MSWIVLVLALMYTGKSIRNVLDSTSTCFNVRIFSKAVICIASDSTCDLSSISFLHTGQGKCLGTCFVTHSVYMYG